MHVIGLTGGVGTGKSTVSKYIQELGAVLVDADKVGHESYRPGALAYKDIVAAFGPRVLQPNGEIDRKALGAIVFNDPKALAKLNSIVHPRMKDMIEEKLAELSQQGVKAVILEAAILIEAKWNVLVDEVWVTYAPEQTVIKRVKDRNNWTEEQIKARINAQLPQSERAKHANVVIDTDCSLDELRRRVQELWNKRIMKNGARKD